MSKMVQGQRVWFNFSHILGRLCSAVIFSVPLSLPPLLSVSLFLSLFFFPDVVLSHFSLAISRNYFF